MEEEKIKKVELLKRLISLKNELNRYEKAADEDRRKIRVDIDRKTSELKAMIIGNEKDIEKLWRRDDDHTEDLKELQDLIQWVEKTILGVLITVILGFIIKTFFNI